MRKTISRISAIALAAGLAWPAMAQNAAATQTAQAPEAPEGVGEIVVTAQRRAENVQDVPIAISAFTAQALQERAIGNVSALSAVAPNVTLDASSPFSGSTAVLSAFVRGVGSNDFAFNIDPGVGVYLDGVYLARSIGSNQDLLDVERIEVLKGPQGTLFGRNSVGGAISIVTHDPGDEFAFRGDLTTGSYRRMQVRGVVDVPLTDTLKSSLAFSMLNRKGYQKRLSYTSDTPFVTDGFTSFPASGYSTGSRQGGDNTWSLRGKLKWDNGGPFHLVISGDYSDTDQDSVPNTVLGTTETLAGPFAGLAENNLVIPIPPPQGPINTALDVVTGSSGFLFAGLYNFCIGATDADIAARNAQNVCGPRSSVNGYNTLSALAGVNLDGNPLNNRLPYDSRWVNTDKDTTYANGNNFSKLRQGGIGATLEYDVSDATSLKSITSYRKIDFKAGVDLDNSPLEFLQTSFIVKQSQFSQELQVLGHALDNKLNYVLGGYYFHESGDLRDFVTFAEGLLQVDGPGHVKTDAYAAFGQIDWRPIDLIGVTIGARYTHEDKEYEGAQADVNGFNYKLFNCVPAGPACAPIVGFPTPDQPFRYYVTGVNKQSFNNFSPKVGVQVHPNDDVMLYGSWARGYKTGGWTTRLSNPLDFAPTFGPEKAETFELGVKSEFLDRRLQVNAAVFTTKYKDIQLNFQQGVSPTVQNAGDARIKGAELEVNAAPGGGFTLQGSIGYLDAYYTDVLGPAQVAPNPLQAGVFAGASLPKSPHWKINASPRYEFPIGSARVVLLADWTHTTKMRTDTEGTFLIARPSTDIVNASVTFKPKDDRFEVTIGGTNLTDERYLVNGQFQGAGGVIYGTYSRPAEWYARLGVRF